MVKKEKISLEEERLKEKGRKISIREGNTYSVMDGFGLRNISPFAIALGASNFQISLLSSIPSLLGNFSQLFSYKLMERFSRKKICAFFIFLQAFMWLLLLIPGWLYFKGNISGEGPANLLVLIYTLLIVFGSIAGPIWSSWMKDLVPSEIAGKYFGKRNEIIGFFVLIFAILGSFILDYFKKTNLFLGFIILFGASFLLRSISAYLFTMQYEPKFKSDRQYYFSFTQFLKKMWFNNFGKFTIFLALITFSVSISSPFFSVYVLSDLGFKSIQFGYIYYFLVLGFSSSIASIISMPFWGKLIDQHGTVRIMKFSGFFIGFVPLFWAISIFFRENFIFLILFLTCVELFSGFIWAGFNLATGTFVYNATTRQRMPLCVAYMSVLNGIGVFFGAMLGGFFTSFQLKFLILDSILLVFILSGIIRFIIYLTMVNKIHEVREKVDVNFDFPKELKDGVLKSFNNLRQVEFFEFMRVKRLWPKQS